MQGRYARLQMRLIAASLALGVLIVLGAGLPAQAQTTVGGTGTWTMVGQPVFSKVGIQEGLEVIYHNNLDVPTQGLIIMVVHNSLGQMLGYGTATLSLNASATAVSPNLLIAFGVSGGNYSASVFAFTFSGVAISNTTTGTYSF